MEKAPQELIKERTRRVEDAIQLKIPDRVPFVPSFQFFPAKYAGISFREAMYDYDKLGMALKKLILDLQPDMYTNLYHTLAVGPTLEILDYKQLRWSGHGLSSDRTYQYVEGEYMKAEEYDAFIADPSDFMLRTFFPRVYGVLEPLGQLLPLPWIHHYLKTVSSIAILGRPEVAGAFEALLKAGAEAQRMMAKASEFDREMESLGFPGERGTTAYTPFDYIGDCLRGTRGIMLDMYRHPDKLIMAMERLVPRLNGPAPRLMLSTVSPSYPVSEATFGVPRVSTSFPSGVNLRTMWFPSSTA